jgi:hypothetical protein
MKPNVVDSTLPDHNDSPAEPAQECQITCIASRIAGKFCLPITPITLRLTGYRTSMSMPKAPVDQDNGPIFSENNVGFTRQGPDVQSESKPGPMKVGPH